MITANPTIQLQECSLVLCNAHHQRELERVIEQDNQTWARDTQQMLLETNARVKAEGGQLSLPTANDIRQRYLDMLQKVGDTECPAPDESQRKPGQKGRLKRSKARNLLERLTQYEEDVQRFMFERDAPFTYNIGEQALRMMKVQQKVSGCFRSFGGALMHCPVRCYLTTSQKHGLSVYEALSLIYNGEWPGFMVAFLNR